MDELLIAFMYRGRKTVKEWLQAESKYKKDVKQTRVPVYKSGDRQIARIGAEEADIDLTPEGKQHGAPIGKLPDQLLSLIFQQCSHIQTLSTVVTVCRQWRRAGLDPFVVSSLKRCHVMVTDFPSISGVMFQPSKCHFSSRLCNAAKVINDL